ncbi:Imm47 family immunity protein [Bordetella genomosp. 10]|uniref:Imm47 family immunity protein n=1 Tax=Bordetella genomosp. 10 TaxID=1416804 RepID=UPI001178C6F0|nr:Imm47 family immunity protein [Bordetella genomosp. 10]
MEKFDIINPGVWFGPLSESSNLALETHDSAKTRLEKLCARMKSGDFSARPQLEQLILSSEETAVVRQAIRLYCFTCRHKNVEFIGRAIEKMSHDDVSTWVSSAPDTLSPEIVPYLFALLGKHSDTSVIDDVLASLYRLFPSKFSESDDNLSALAQRFNAFGMGRVQSAYYYQDALSHPGALCKTLITTTAEVSSKGIEFPLANIPTILSIWSGIECPVSYGQKLDNEALPKVMNYVRLLSEMQWHEGSKYFYRHEVK